MVVIAIIHHMIILIIIYVLFRFTKSPRTTYIMNMLTSSDTLKINNDWPRQQTKLKLTTYHQIKPHHQIKSTSYHQAQGLECFHTKTEKRWIAERNKKTKKWGVQACHVILKNLADLYLACYCYIQIHISCIYICICVHICIHVHIYICIPFKTFLFYRPPPPQCSARPSLSYDHLILWILSISGNPGNPLSLCKSF